MRALASVRATSPARRVLSLVVLVVVLSGCQPCDPPLQYGAIGFVERPGELGIVLVDGVPEPYFYIREGERDGVSVVWTTDGREFSSPEPLASDSFDGPGRMQTICDPSGRCVHADGDRELSLSLRNQDEWFPRPVPEHRHHVFARVDECDEVNGAMAAALLPGTRELVVAYGQDGLAVLQEDGWDWRDVHGWQRRALALSQVESAADPFVKDLIEDMWFAIMGAVLMALVLVMGALREHRGVRQWVIGLWLIAALAGLYVVGLPTVIMLGILGVPSHLAITVTGTSIAGLAAVLVGRLLPKSVRRRYAVSTGLGTAPGGLAVLAWYLGMPVTWGAAMTLAVATSAGGVLLTARLLRERGRARDGIAVR